MKLWVVEMWVEDRKRYEPTGGAAFTRARGRMKLSVWRSLHPGRKFRLTPYVPGGKS